MIEPILDHKIYLVGKSKIVIYNGKSENDDQPIIS